MSTKRLDFSSWFFLLFWVVFMVGMLFWALSGTTNVATAKESLSSHCSLGMPVDETPEGAFVIRSTASCSPVVARFIDKGNLDNTESMTVDIWMQVQPVKRGTELVFIVGLPKTPRLVDFGSFYGIPVRPASNKYLWYSTVVWRFVVTNIDGIFYGSHMVIVESPKFSPNFPIPANESQTYVLTSGVGGNPNESFYLTLFVLPHDSSRDFSLRVLKTEISFVEIN